MDDQPPAVVGSRRLTRRYGGLVFNGAPPRARDMKVEWITDEQHTGIRFTIDGALASTATVDWSGVDGPPSNHESDVLNWSLLVLVSQLCLAETASIEGSPHYPDEQRLQQLLRMLYDIRCFCDETEYRRPLRWTRTNGSRLAPVSSSPLSDRRALVLLSGGFDSTLAALVLKEAGFDLIGLHVQCNRHVETVEENAAHAIAHALDIPIRTARLVVPDEERIGRYYSRSFGEYPFYNSVPHGRDFPLAVIAGILAKRWECGHVVFGHEKESRHKVLEDSGRKIFRHDVESSEGAGLTQQFLTSSLHPGLSFWSPIAGLSLYRIRRIMLTRFPTLSARTRSCFWGHRCGKCLKCLSTYVMQRHLQVEAHPFEANLFADRDDDDMRLFAEPDRPSEVLGYGPQMHYAMTKIIDDHLDGPDDYWLQHFRAHGLAEIRKQWNRIAAICEQTGPADRAGADLQHVLETLR